ncbi:antigen WC1.1-like isoform X2 [Cololabis saira]|uniref:antigen WC1.1-like isoform X2 n=1 Tax=Cololabis saira TaxID=129043 RepID=UPI002AD1E5F0|nr:antigen WC1.1-like isoform X2 [Cololabis saira]
MLPADRQTDVHLDVDQLLLLLLLWSSGNQAEEHYDSPDSSHFRVVGGASRCAGVLEMHDWEGWRPLAKFKWTLTEAAFLCQQLDCGSAVSAELRESSSDRDVWWMDSDLGSKHFQTVSTKYSNIIMEITCSDSVRLVNGTTLCSGRLEVKSSQIWSSVCEDDFDLQDAEVVCRELGCGAPLVLQGGLYGEVEDPVRNTCSTGGAVELTCSELESFRLVGGASRCAGTLEMKHLGEWRTAYALSWTMKETSDVCKHLDCGSSFSFQHTYLFDGIPQWMLYSCLSTLRDCTASVFSNIMLNITCLDSVRLVNGFQVGERVNTTLCSGRLEVKSNQSWSSVCEDDFDLQDAEVVCRELSCGAPLVLQGGLYGEVEDPVWTREFQCRGDESALLDCGSSGSVRNNCSTGGAVELTCSDPLRLVGGASRCAGTVEFKLGEDWKQVSGYIWNLRRAAVICEHLDCGAILSMQTIDVANSEAWLISEDFVRSGFYLKEHAFSADASNKLLDVTCSDSVRLVNGTDLCSGRLEVKSSQIWSSVCEDDFDLQDAEVVCRELSCGAPLVLQGGLYGEEKDPVWTREFQCRGDESALLDCGRSGSVRNTCSPGRALGLTCSEPVRLVGGASRCAGTLEMKHLGDWKLVYGSEWTLKEAAVICEHLDCGSAVYIGERKMSSHFSVWDVRGDCIHYDDNDLRDCPEPDDSNIILNITCSGPVRLVNGTTQCSGRLEVKSSQIWSSVCEDDFDLQDAEVVCRELSCGAPLVLQGGLYGEVEEPVWTREFQCRGDESALLDCGSPGSVRNTCSTGGAVELTCSEPVRLVGGASRCEGTVELKLGDWRPVGYMTLEEASVVCESLDCGPAVSSRLGTLHSAIPMWHMKSRCIDYGFYPVDCATDGGLSNKILNVTCSDLLVQPIISVSSFMNGVSRIQQQGFQVYRGSNFAISCSIQPQYPGGSFQLSSSTSDFTSNYTQPAVNHSAYFRFPVVEPAHQGNYSCVYRVKVFSYEFSSESRPLSLTVSDPPVPRILIIVVVLPLFLLLVVFGLYYFYKVVMSLEERIKRH